MLHAHSIRLAGVLIASAIVLTSTPVRAIAPSAPTNLAAVVDGQAVTLTWTAAANSPTVYTLQAGMGPGETIASFELSGATTSFHVLAPPGTYHVRIIASNADGVSAPSNEIVVVVTCAAGTVKNFRVMQRETEAFLFWNPVANAASYSVLAGFAPGQTDVQFNLPANTFNVLVPPGIYWARIVARNGCGAGTASTEVEVTSPNDTIRVQDPAPGTLLSLPDIEQLIYRLAAANPPTLNNSCPNGRKYGEPNPWLNYMVDALRTYDTRFGYNAKPTRNAQTEGYPIIAAGDEITYFAGSGPAQGSSDVFAIDILFNHCDVQRGGQPAVTFRNIAPEPASWTGAGRFVGDER